MLLFTQSRQVDFELLITKLKQNKEDYTNFCDHRNGAINIVADTSSPVTTEMEGKSIFGITLHTLFQALSFICPMPQ